MQVARAANATPSLEPECIAALERLGPFEPNPHVAVALSGGSDSMALVLLADEWAREQGGRITALTVDHGLRAEAQTEAQQVGAWMKQRNIAHVVLTPAHSDEGKNLMQAARAWRYDALSEWCRAHDVLHCLLAHHAGDARETVALHMARGATEDGPSGMRAARNYRGVRFLRPLLGFEKETLRDFLRAQDAPWVEDPTNSDERFARARLRKAAAALPEPTPAVRTAREKRVAGAAMRCITLNPAGSALLLRSHWLALEKPIATQLLADLLRTLGGDTRRPRKHKTLRLAEAISAGRPFKRTLAGCVVEMRDDAVAFTREKASKDSAFTPAKPLAASAFW